MNNVEPWIDDWKAERKQREADGRIRYHLFPNMKEAVDACRHMPATTNDVEYRGYGPGNVLCTRVDFTLRPDGKCAVAIDFEYQDTSLRVFTEEGGIQEFQIYPKADWIGMMIGALGESLTPLS